MCTEDRIDVLERELIRTKRHVRWLLAGIALTVCSSVLSWAGAAATIAVHAQPSERVIRAHAFVVEDMNGANRAILDVTAGEPRLAFYDVNGKLRVALAVTAGGPGLALYDVNDKPRATLVVSAGGPGLAFSDADGTVSWRAP